MTDIKDYVPDTSKYTDPADRLIALALVMKSGRPMQYMHQSQKTFRDDDEGITHVTSSLFHCLVNGSDYRAKPESRVVWVNFTDEGQAVPTAYVYASEEEARRVRPASQRLATAVRVELPDDQ